MQCILGKCITNFYIYLDQVHYKKTIYIYIYIIPCYQVETKFSKHLDAKDEYLIYILPSSPWYHRMFA